MITTDASRNDDNDNQANKAKLDALAKDAAQEIGAYSGLVKKAAVHLYRAGRSLAAAKALLGPLGITWADFLSEHGIADSTARQAVRLYTAATAHGDTEAALDGLSITDAKIKFGVVSPRPPKPKPKPITESSDAQRELLARRAKEEADRQAREAEEADRQAREAEEEGDDQGTGLFGGVDIDEILAEHHRFLAEDALAAWNDAREQPFDADYLLWLYDTGLIEIEEGAVRYYGTDTARLVRSLTDHLAPVLADLGISGDQIESTLRLLTFGR